MLSYPLVRLAGFCFLGAGAGSASGTGLAAVSGHTFNVSHMNSACQQLAAAAAAQVGMPVASGPLEVSAKNLLFKPSIFLSSDCWSVLYCSAWTMRGVNSVSATQSLPAEQWPKPRVWVAGSDLPFCRS